MLCPKCGRENSDKNKFCNGCGKTLQVSFTPPTQQFTPPPIDSSQLKVPQPRMIQHEPRPSLNLLVVGLAIVAAVIGLVWAASWFFNKNSEITLSNTANISVAQSTLNSSVTQSTPNLTESKSSSPRSYEGMAFVPAGEFMMGRDNGSLEEEKPAHKVAVNPFFMDIYEVTNEQYVESIKLTRRQPPLEWRSGGYPNSQAKYPVVGVNWEDANAFCKSAGKRLPTEEEWEFAARGPGNFLYPWGNDWKQDQANIGSQAFAEVGKFKGASPFGIYDLIGNAGEWTASDFKAYPNGVLSDYFVGKENLKTIRGGSFETMSDFATTTYRIGWRATGAETYNRTGFRCVQHLQK